MTNAIAVAHGAAVTIASASGASSLTSPIDTAVLTDGRYVVTYGTGSLVQWGTPPFGVALTDSDIFARVLDVDGNGAAAFEVPATPDPALPPTVIGTSPLLQQTLPDVTATANGGFAISWQQDVAAQLPTIVLRAFDSTGAGGPDVLVNSFTNQLGGGPAVAALSGGSFVDIYGEFIPPPDQKTDFVGKIVAPDGSSSAEFSVAKGAPFGFGFTSFQQPEVLPLADGGFYAVIGRTDFQGSGFSRLSTLKYSASGILQEQSEIASGPSNFSTDFDAELMADGGLAVTRSSYDFNIQAATIWLDLRTAAGTTSEFQVGQAQAFNPTVDLAVLSDGRFAVTWVDNSQRMVRIMAADGSGGLATAVGAHNGGSLQVEALPQNRFVMTWGDGASIQSQVFDIAQPPTVQTTSLTRLEDLPFPFGVDAVAATGGALTYTLAPATATNDNALFLQVPVPNQGQFISNFVPDFEHPIDQGGIPGDNIYTVDVIISEAGGLATTVTMNITILDQQTIINGTAGNDDSSLGGSDVTGTGAEDTLSGLAGNDHLIGGASDDILDGGPGADILDGGPGSDTASYADALAPVTASLLLGVGITGDATGDTYNSIENLTGSNSNDYLVGDNGDNVIKGGDGYDVIYGLDGNNTLIGGDKDDIYVSTNTNGTDTIVEKPDEGLDTVYANHAFTLTAGVEQLVLFGTAPSGTGNDEANTIAGNTDAGVVIDGKGGNDVIFGSTFADTLHGGDGDDVLIGVGGGDVFDGGAGNDVYVSISKSDTFVENGNDGFDTLFVGDDYVNTSMVDQVIMTRFALTLTGSAANEILVGSNVAFVTIDGKGGDDTIFGSAYGDVLTGGAGNDALIGGGGIDVFAFHAGSGVDTIYDFQSTASAGAGHDFIAFYRPVPSSADPVITDVNLGSIASSQISYDGSFITLYGVQASQVQASDFLFLPEPQP